MHQSPLVGPSAAHKRGWGGGHSWLVIGPCGKGDYGHSNSISESLLESQWNSDERPCRFTGPVGAWVCVVLCCVCDVLGLCLCLCCVYVVFVLCLWFLFSLVHICVELVMTVDVFFSYFSC